MESITADHTRRTGGLLPIDDGDVLVQFGQLKDRVVDLHPLVTVERDREQQRRTRRQAVQDLVQLLEVVLLITVIVASEMHDRGVPVLVGFNIVRQSIFDHVSTEFDESSRFGIDFDIPAQRRRCVAEFVAVPLRGRRKNRVADDQEPSAIDPLRDRLDDDAFVVDRPRNRDRSGVVDDAHGLRLRNRAGQHADSGDGRRGSRPWQRGIGALARSARAAHRSHKQRADRECDRSTGPISQHRHH
jgi:hypothetical protein